MLKKFRNSIILFLRLVVFLACAGSFFILFGQEFPFLLVLSRTSVITFTTFVMVYALMLRVYGGYDIGQRKSKPIVFSLALSVLVADLMAHFFLCIMNITVINGGQFVYENPLLLLVVYLLQVVWIVALTYFGNGMYFRFHKPQKSLIITRRGEDVETLVRRVGRFKKQYCIETIAYIDQKDVLAQIDAHEAVFIYNLAISERTGLIEYCYERKRDVYYSLELPDVVALGGTRVMFDDKNMMRVTMRGMSFEQRIIKRLMDIAIASLGLLITSPILLITAVAIKLEDGGPVFFKQNRATYAGRVFQVIKFRSMKVEGSVNRSVTKNDDRITKVGRVIRKFRIDELPQLINVLRSDMSIVGPRPEMLENVNKYTADLPEFSYRLRAKAGLTGYAQIYGKYNTSPKDKLIMDLTYIAQYSIKLDVKLILRTILVLLTPEESTEAFEVKKTEEK